eukprot:14874555-Alexandrium_andersonii.AAC.1
MSASLVGSEMCIRDRHSTGCCWRGPQLHVTGQAGGRAAVPSRRCPLRRGVSRLRLRRALLINPAVVFCMEGACSFG